MKLLGIPESCSDVNDIVNTLTRQKLYTKNSTTCPIAQDAFNPFINTGVKMEIPDPEYDTQ